MKRFETQRVSDAILAEALRNSRWYRLQERERQERQQRDWGIFEGRRQQAVASMKGATARMLWATKNQDRLIRVFA